MQFLCLNINQRFITGTFNKKKSPGIPGPSNHTHFPKILSVAVIMPIVVVICTVVVMIPIRMITHADVAPRSYRYKSGYDKGKPYESLFHDN